MKKVFVYVGHSNWGKSFALKKLTNNSSREKRCTINGKTIYVRKMSNDDDGKDDKPKLLNFVKKIPKMNYNYFIIAYCPNHDKANTEKAKQNAMDILDTLKKSCEIYFFVQEEKFGNSDKKINPEKLTYLKEIGKEVFVLEGQKENDVRAEEFKKFIEKNL